MSGSLDFSTVRHSAVLKSDLLDGLFLAVCFLTEGVFFGFWGFFYKYSANSSEIMRL